LVVVKGKTQYFLYLYSENYLLKKGLICNEMTLGWRYGTMCRTSKTNTMKINWMLFITTRFWLVTCYSKTFLHVRIITWSKWEVETRISVWRMLIVFFPHSIITNLNTELVSTFIHSIYVSVSIFGIMLIVNMLSILATNMPIYIYNNILFLIFWSNDGWNIQLWYVINWYKLMFLNKR